jgi:hypothetical protein
MSPYAQPSHADYYDAYDKAVNEYESKEKPMDKIKNAINDLLYSVRNALVYDTSETLLRERVIGLYDSLRTLQADVEALNGSKPATRQCFTMKSRELYDSSRNMYFVIPDQNVYVIDGFVTDSKILAIKKVRDIDGCGLLEAKTLVDALGVKAQVAQ